VFGTPFGVEARAQQIERLDGVARVGVGLLLDHVPPVSDAERRGADPEPPRQVEPPADLTDGGVDELELPALPNQELKAPVTSSGPDHSMAPGGSIARNRTVGPSVVAMRG
jgi:hypothetical protein